MYLFLICFITEVMETHFSLARTQSHVHSELQERVGNACVSRRIPRRKRKHVLINTAASVTVFTSGYEISILPYIECTRSLPERNHPELPPATVPAPPGPSHSETSQWGAVLSTKHGCSSSWSGNFSPQLHSLSL